MFSYSVIEYFYVPENGLTGFPPRSVGSIINEFFFQSAEKALGNGVVIAVAFSRHALDHLTVRQLFSKVIAGELHAAVRVEDQTGLRPATAVRLLKCRQDGGRSRHSVAHGPADNSPVEEIKHHRQVQPAFPRSDVGDVGCPDFTGLICRKVPVHKIR